MLKYKNVNILIKQNSKLFVPTIHTPHKSLRFVNPYVHVMITLINVHIIFSGLEMSQLSKL